MHTYTYINTRIHTYAHTYIHTHIHTYTHVRQKKIILFLPFLAKQALEKEVNVREFLTGVLEPDSFPRPESRLSISSLEKFLSTWGCLERFPFFLSHEFLKISDLFQYFSTQIGSINKTYYVGHRMVILGNSDVHFSPHDSPSHSSCLPCLLNIGFVFFKSANIGGLHT